MKRNILVGSMLFAAVTVGAAAQSAAPSSQPSDQKQSTPNQTMTITGCLQAAGSAASATGTSGSATKAPSKADNFVLANATAAATGGHDDRRRNGAPGQSACREHRRNCVRQHRGR